MSRLSATIATVFAGMVLTATAVPAMELEITPFAGVTVPNQALLIDATGSGYFHNTTHKIFGLALSTPVASRFAVELTTALGDGEMELVGTDAVRIASSVVLADLRGKLRLLGGDDAQVSLIAGVGYTQFRNGLFDALNQQDEDTQYAATIAGIAGLGLRARLTDRLFITVDAVDRIHEHGVDTPAGLTGFEEEMQHDMTLTAGLTFPLK